MTNGNSAEREALFKRIHAEQGWMELQDIFNAGWDCALSVCADGGKGEAVGYADVCPGSGGGFTMAVFKSSDVPEGAALYTAPQAECAPREAQPVFRCNDCGGFDIEQGPETMAPTSSDAPTPERAQDAPCLNCAACQPCSLPSSVNGKCPYGEGA